MIAKDIASWLGVAGTALQLLGGVMTLWSLLSAPKTWMQKMRALAGALWRSRSSEVAAKLSVLNAEDRSRVLQGVAILALGYLLALVSQGWLILLG
jgi:hypothetical protein